MSLSNIIITGVDSFAYIPVVKGRKFVMKNRPNTGLVFCPDGSNIYLQNGEKYVCDNNHVLLLPEGADYVLEPAKDSICPLINFKCYQRMTKIQSMSVDDSRRLLGSFDKLSCQWVFNENDNYYHAMAYLYNTLGELKRQNPVETAKMPDFILDAVKYIYKNLSEPTLCLDSIAKNAGVSSVHFRKTFRDYYGTSPMHYINGLRIKQAEVLLKSCEVSVEQVAVCTGFSSVYSFSRAFRAANGCSPSEYRRKYR